MTDKDEVLKIENLRAGYGEMEILHGIDLSVCRNETVVIIGPNGAGKSTVLKGIMGLLNVRKGTICLGSEDLIGLTPDVLVKKGIGYVPQVRNVFLNMTVLENLEMGGYTRKGSLEKLLEKVYHLFPVLKEKSSSKAETLSGGQRQMLAMSNALMVEPKLMLLDEPTAGVSPINREIIFESIVKLRNAGVPILMVEQNVREALQIADRGYILVDGRNRLDAKGEELLGMGNLGHLFFDPEGSS